MNFLLALLVAITSWIVFASMNSLASAGDGCCKDNSCGKSFFDGVVWWSNLFIAIIFTLYVLVILNNSFNPYMKVPTPPMVQMVFGKR